MCSTNKNVCTTCLDLPLAEAVVGAALEVEVLLTALVCPLTRASGTSSGGFILVCPTHQNHLAHPLRNTTVSYERMVLRLSSRRRRCTTTAF